MRILSVGRTGLVWSQWARRSAVLLCGVTMLLQGSVILVRSATTHVAAAELVTPVYVVSEAPSPAEPSRIANTSSAPRAPEVQSGAVEAPVRQCTKVSVIQPINLSLKQDGLTQVVDAPKYYTVYGHTINEVQRQLSQCSPTGYFATTNYNMNWMYSTRRVSGELCAITHVRVGMHIAAQYPSWQADGLSSAQLASQWQQLSASLVNHEQGHVTRNLQTAQSLVTSLRAIPPAGCSQIKAQATSIVNDHYTRLKAAHNSYDVQTNHGQTQGAWL